MRELGQILPEEAVGKTVKFMTKTSFRQAWDRKGEYLGEDVVITVFEDDTFTYHRLISGYEGEIIIDDSLVKTPCIIFNKHGEPVANKHFTTFDTAGILDGSPENLQKLFPEYIEELKDKQRKVDEQMYEHLKKKLGK